MTENSGLGPNKVWNLMVPAIVSLKSNCKSKFCSFFSFNKSSVLTVNYPTISALS